MARPRNSAKPEQTADEQTGAAEEVAPVAESVEEQAPASDAEQSEQESVEEQAPASDAEQSEQESVEEQAPASVFTVTGAAVVLRATDGAERYLYKGARFAPAAFVSASVEHAVANRLVAEAK